MRIIFCVLFLTMLGCNSTKSKVSSNKIEEVAFQKIAKGSLFGDGIEGISESRFAITNGKAWGKLQNNMNKENNVSSSFKEESIDFSTEMLVCVFDKVRSTGGISISIDKISIENDSIKINYSNQKPAPGEMVTTVITQPYHIVKTQKRKGVLVFIKEGK
tara:strand:- start:110 stop:589 length:480 start_codon:yes stop_codon:yes gene_type:complete